MTHSVVRRIRRCPRLALLLLAIASVAARLARAQDDAGRRVGTPPVRAAAVSPAYSAADTAALQALEWRSVGPYRGGRADAVVGVPSNPYEFYMGTAGGGVWKTVDGGTSWSNVSDGFFAVGTVGAIAVAPSDTSVVYVGTGEAAPRGQMSSFGDGVYRSADGGKSWKHVGLDSSRQIAKLVVSPSDANVVYAAVLGSRWTPSDDRGVYRSTDGGATWKRVLFVDRGAGAVDLAMSAKDPRVMYAAFWDYQRRPWYLRSGGPHSGIWKTTDGGESWTRLAGGLPSGVVGRIGVAVSPASPDRVYAVVEADSFGMYRSDDAGRSWRRTSADRALATRPWYYSSVVADPKSPDVVYVNTFSVLRSRDGGSTFATVAAPHGDHHDMWINPADPRVMINAHDAGATVSYDGGATWSTYFNQPTGQFYRVQTDDLFPYNLYGGQQDHGSVVIPSRVFGATAFGRSDGITRSDWRAHAGCETASFAFDPKRPRYTYATCYLGGVQEFDTETGMRRNVQEWPALGFAEPSDSMKYRFNWSAPLTTSPFDPRVMYHGGNVLFVSRDRGNGWTAISPDLTRNDRAHQGLASGPFWNDGSGGEVYNTIFYVVESPHERGTIWVGTDDGLVQLTRDGGRTWTNVTPPGLAEGLVHAIEVSPHDRATAYVAFTRTRFGDDTPHLFRTRDYGKTWTDLAGGLPRAWPARVVREDPTRRDLLYAGTENGVWLSFDGGAHWQSLQRNLPRTPVSDLRVHENDLVASTEGRGFWILDDVTPLHALSDSVVESALHVFAPRRAYRIVGSGGPSTDEPAQGKNAPAGAVIRYWLGASAADTAHPPRVEIVDARGAVVRTFPGPRPVPPDTTPWVRPPARRGMNQIVWNLRSDAPAKVPGLPAEGGSGYVVASGRYLVRVTAGGRTDTASFVVAPDPRVALPAAEEREQVAMARALMQRVDTILRTVVELRATRDTARQLLAARGGGSGGSALARAAASVIAGVDTIEGRLVQPRTTSTRNQDGINLRNGLAAQFAHLQEAVDGSYGPVTRGAREVMAALDAEWAGWRRRIDALRSRDVAALRALAGRAMRATAAPHYSAAEPGAPPPLDTAAIERALRDEMRDTHTPGAAIAVVRGARVVYLKGFGVASVETGEPVTPATLFRIGSTTKMVTGLTAVRLEQQGRLRIASPIGAYARGLAPALARLTLDQLLTHRGGLVNEAAGAGPHDDAALGERVRSWTSSELFAPAGDVYSYSGPGYWLAGYAIEQAAHASYADVVRAQVLEPLGMTRSTFRPLVAMTYPMAQDHRVRDSSAVVLRPFTDDVTTWPSGSLFSSAEELARLTIALVDSGRLDGKQAIPAAAVAAVSAPRAPVPGDDGCRYGYGLSVCTRGGVRTLTHYGFRVGSGSVITMAPDSQAAVVILANRNGAIFTRTAAKAMELLVGLPPEGASAASAASAASTASTASPTRADDGDDARFVGTFANGPDTLRIRRAARGLTYRYGGKDYATRPDGPDALLVLGDGGEPEQRFMLVRGAASGRWYLHDGLSAFGRLGGKR